jgi:glycerophosphoryl diester phosphodiesterase
VEIIAHRGASYDAPENTLAAVNLAWRQNADAVEVDVHLSRDGQIVVIHDESTRKTGGVGKKVSDQTLAELKTLDVGGWKAAQWAGERIPTLAEVLASVPRDKRLFIEIKGREVYVAEFGHTFRRSGRRPEQVVAIGFALETMAKIKRALPEIEVCWIAEFKRNWQRGGWLLKPETLIQKAKDAGLDGLDLGARGPITATLVNQVKEANLKLYVWTVDSPAKARKLKMAGVDGITTNRPGWLRERLGVSNDQ